MELKTIIGKNISVFTKPKLHYWLYMLFILSLNPGSTLGCNCVNRKCILDGSCQHGYKCEEKFFGYYCEYNNMNRNDRDSIPQLSDEDITTCANVGEDFATNYAKTRIYMIRLIVKDSSTFKNISIVFKDWSRERVCNGHVVLVEKTIVEYYCTSLDFSNGLTIRGLGGNEICHLHVTDGRNMAVGASVITSTASIDPTYYLKQGLIDGKRLAEKNACFLTKRYEEEFKIDIFLRSGSLVNFVDIFDSYRLKLPIAGTTVEFINKAKQTTRSVRLLVSPYRAHYILHGSPVWRITLLKKGQFGACEIEIRGDCGDGKYGHDCMSTCKSRCKDFRCTSKGMCISCREGLMAPRCCKPFCDTNKDCGDDGNCINGCVKKKYGLDCSKDCSNKCAGDGSCDEQGTCIAGCKIGFFGRSCALTCSRNCARDKRCHVNGTCVYGCINRYFGQDCSNLCSRNCAGNGSCNFEGKCNSGCKIGFYHWNCAVACRHDCPKNVRCDDTGSCPKPCSSYCAKDGSCYQNHSCVHGCLAGFFGKTCSSACSSHCAKDGSCDNYGLCKYGCQPGYFTLNCTERCDPPHFGLYCNETCPETCWRQQCDYAGHCMGKSPGNTTEDLRGSISFAERLTPTAFMILLTLCLVTLLSSP